MWIAKFLRALAQSLEGRHRYIQTGSEETTGNLLQNISRDLGDCKTALEALASETQQVANDKKGLTEQDYLSLRLKEYEVLRAEQRTRLDAANRLIHYNVLVIGALIAGAAASYKTDGFTNVLLNVFLVMPLISMPFAFAQWNDEIIVGRIADYINEKLKTQIGVDKDKKYWEWEKLHTSDRPPRLVITAIVRSGFFPLSATFSLVMYNIKHHGFPDARDRYKQVMYIADTILIILGVGVNLAPSVWPKIKSIKAKLSRGS